MNRRDFLKISAAGAASLALARRAYAFVNSTPLSKFTQPLPGLGPTGIAVASPDTTKYPGYDYYRIFMGQYTARLHPSLPKATTLWGYADATKLTGTQQPNYRPLGGAIVATRGRPVRITWENRLPPLSIIPIDPTIPGADAGAFQNRTVPHLHGGLVPWTSDGGPFAWFSPGVSAANPKTHGPDWQSGDYLYPNDQSARLQWYHDHAFGQTRTNAYANLASAYLITDSTEAGLVTAGLLPDAVGVPLVFQDKTFVPAGILSVDPTWKWGKPGDLWYPHVYEPAQPSGAGRWEYGPDAVPPATGTLPLPSISAVPEAFFDHMLVNCAVFPFLEVQRRRYRFRVLNACNARFLNVQLYKAQSNTVGDPLAGEPNLSAAGPRFYQVGTEGGFLRDPVVLNDPPVQIQLDVAGNATSAHNLLLAPAERADLVIDFSECAAGDVLILYNDAPAPFPGGDPRYDYFTNDGDQTALGGAPNTVAGFGPNTRTLMQIRVVAGGTPDAVPTADWFAALSAALPLAYATSQPPDLDPTGLVPLGKTLNEDFDNYGRLVQRLGTTTPNGTNNQGMPTYSRDFMSAVTETASNHETQVWDIFNLTGDTHPIHFHLVNVQILGRAPFDFITPDFQAIGPFTPPEPNERGWKETVRMNPGEVTRVIMKFDSPAPPAWAAVKTSPRTGGHEYVWHCHILEHEEHDMMRSLVVT